MMRMREKKQVRMSLRLMRFWLLGSLIFASFFLLVELIW